MTTRATPLSDAQKKRIRILHNMGFGHAELGRRFNRSPSTIWSVVNPIPRVGLVIESHPSIPKEVLVERDRRMSRTPRTLTAALMKDPLPGYSALERRA